MERVDRYFVSDTGELFNTRAEALEAADDYETCWAYAESQAVEPWLQ